MYFRAFEKQRMEQGARDKECLSNTHLQWPVSLNKDLYFSFKNNSVMPLIIMNASMA